MKADERIQNSEYRIGDSQFDGRYLCIDIRKSPRNIEFPSPEKPPLLHSVFCILKKTGHNEN